MSGLYASQPSGSSGGSALGKTASGAATGAAIGSVVPGLGTGVGALLGGGIGLLSSLFGGILGNKAQKAANATNLQIARETNQTQMDIANANNQLSYEMFLRQLEYASPSEQRKMLEEAGYNPNLFAQGVTSSAANAPSLQQPTLHTPQVSPVNALSSQISTLGRETADIIKAVSESDLLKAQKRNQDIKNDYEAALLSENVKGAKVANAYNVETFNDRVMSATLNNYVLNNQRKLMASQVVAQTINNATLSKMNESQIEQIIAITEYYAQSGDAQKALKDYYDAGVRYQDAQAMLTAVQAEWLPFEEQTKRISANAQQTSAGAAVISSKAQVTQARAAMVNAVANFRTQKSVRSYYRALTRNQDNINAVFNKFGMKSAAAQFDKLISEAASGRISVKNLSAQTKLLLLDIEKSIYSNQMLSNDLKMYWIREVFGMMQQSVGAGSSAYRDYGIGSKMLQGEKIGAGSMIAPSATTTIPLVP